MQILEKWECAAIRTNLSLIPKNGDLKDLSPNPPNQLKYVDLSGGLFFLGYDWLLMISNLGVWFAPKIFSLWHDSTSIWKTLLMERVI